MDERIVKQALIRRELKKKNDIILFSKWLFEHHIVSKIPKFHKEIYDIILKESNDQVCIAAPRGFSKSTIVSFIYILWQALYKESKFILIISDTYTQAKYLLDTIKRELEDNVRLKAMFGDQTTDKWSEGEIILTNGAKITAKGVGMKVRGIKHREMRPDLIVMDDLENAELVESRDRRDKLLRWFMSEVKPALAIDGKIRYIGTVLHYDSLLNKILKDKNWIRRKYQAIENGKSIWADRYSLKELEKIKQEYRNLGTLDSYFCEYMNDPISDENAQFKQKWFKYFQLSDINIKDFEIFTAVDLAISKDERADYTVVITVGINKQNDLYILDIKRGRWNPYETMDQMFNVYEKWKPVRMGIETVAYQKAMIYFMKDEMRKRNIFIPLKELKADTDKERRIKSLIPRYNIGTVYHQNIHTDLEEELLKFPKGEHDDIIDALAYILQISFPLIKRKKKPKSYKNITDIDPSFKNSLNNLKRDKTSWLEL